MPIYDIVIKGGTVIDGLQTPRYKADVAIKDGGSPPIGGIDASDGAEVVDASGKSSRPASSTCTRTTTARSSGTRGARCRAGTA